MWLRVWLAKVDRLVTAKEGMVRLEDEITAGRSSTKYPYLGVEGWKGSL